MSTTASAQYLDESIIIEGASTGDLYLAGRSVEITGNVDGDVTVAGQRITIDGDISRDLNAAAETLQVRGQVQDDIRAAARSLSLEGPVLGHVVAAGQTVTLGPSAEIGDWAWLAGQTVRIRGTVQDEVRAVGQEVVINGEVLGDVELTGEVLRIGPDAHIHGDLAWRSTNPLDLETGSRVDGQISRLPLPEGWLDEAETGPGLGEVIGEYIFVVLSLAMAAAAWCLLAPRFAARAGELARGEPWKCLGLGLIILIVTPFVSVILFISMIGYLLGLVVLTAYVAYLIAGLLMGINLLADSGLRWYREGALTGKLYQLLAVFIAAAALALSWHLPYLGMLIFIGLWLLGLGSIQLGLMRGSQAQTA